jgi:hypothetical protein
VTPPLFPELDCSTGKFWVFGRKQREFTKDLIRESLRQPTAEKMFAMWLGPKRNVVVTHPNTVHF